MSHLRHTEIGINWQRFGHPHSRWTWHPGHPRVGLFRIKPRVREMFGYDLQGVVGSGWYDGLPGGGPKGVRE